MGSVALERLLSKKVGDNKYTLKEYNDRFVKSEREGLMI